VVHADHDQPRPRYSSSKRFRAGAVALQNGQLGDMNQRASTILPRTSSSASGSELNQCSSFQPGAGWLMRPLTSSVVGGSAVGSGEAPAHAASRTTGRSSAC